MEKTEVEGHAPLHPLSIEVKQLGGESSILDNIRSACARDLPHFTGHAPRNEPLLICGGGPSLLTELNDLRRRMRKGAKVLGVNGTVEVLRKQGVCAWGHVLLDAAPETAAFVPKRDFGCIHFVASQCDPAVFDALAGRDVVVWHALQDVGEREVIEECLPGKPWALVAGGSTVTLRCLNLGYLMGFRKFHLYGVDSCFYGSRQHAYENVTQYSKKMDVWVGGKQFHTSPQMAIQARDFERYLRSWPQLFSGASLNVHGRGLIAEICRERHRLIRQSEGK